MAEYPTLANILAGTGPDEEEIRRQRNADKYGEPWTPRGIAQLPNRLADIGNNAGEQLTDPRHMLHPWQPGLPLPQAAWVRLFNSLLFDAARSAGKPSNEK